MRDNITTTNTHKKISSANTFIKKFKKKNLNLPCRLWQTQDRVVAKEVGTTKEPKLKKF